MWMACTIAGARYLIALKHTAKKARLRSISCQWSATTVATRTLAALSKRTKMLPPGDVYRGRASDGEVEILSEPAEVEQALDAARRQLRAQDRPEEWADTGKVFEDQYVTLYRDPVRFPGGKLGTYLRVAWSEKLGNGVVILPSLNNS